MTKERKLELYIQVKADRKECDRRITYEHEMRKIDPNFVGKFDDGTAFDD